jgi:VWFA-related protein
MQAGIYARRIGLFFVCLIAGAALRAQQPAGIQKENGVYTLHEDTHLVLLDVTVTDKQGHSVTGLKKDDFKLLEDGQPQTIAFFEEHAPVDPAEIAQQKAAAIAGQPPNTFTNYEPFTGKPVTVLLLNELFPLGTAGVVSLHQEMLDVIKKSPPDTPFAVYTLGSELRLVQPVTTDRTLLETRIDAIEMWKSPLMLQGSVRWMGPLIWKGPPIGWERSLNLSPEPPMSVDDLIAMRRRIMTTAMQHLAAGLKDTPGRKNLFAFTGGFQCSVVGSDGNHGAPLCPAYSAFGNDREFGCGLMDTLEQGRMWIYRYYPGGEVGYGFGCGSTGVGVQDLSHYYTLYYTPTNRDWNGKYRATTVEVADKKGLHLAYRKGYYGTPENVEAHYYTATGPASAPVVSGAGGSTIAATVIGTGNASSESLDTVPAQEAPNPEVVFNIQMIPADATVVLASADSKEKQEYRELTLRFSMPASEFKVVQSDAGGYVERLEISAAGYADGRSLETYASQVVANFDGAADPRIANSTITAKLTLNVPEHGRDRTLDVSVRDMATGQSRSMVISMWQVKMPGTQ